METKVNYAAVGAFVLLLGAALVAGLLWIGSGRSYGTRYATYLIYMSESVSGLNLGAPVRYHGVEVGSVRKIALAPQDPQLVRLTLDIERDAPIKQDTVATLRVQGLTGIAYVELSGGSRSSPALRAAPGEPYPVIPARPSLIVRLDKSVSKLLKSLTVTSKSLNALLDVDNRRELAQTLRNLDHLSQTLAARSAAIDSSLGDAARMMRDSARAAAGLPELVARAQRSAEAVDRMANEVSRTSANADRTLGEARSDMRRLGSQTLPQVDALVGELRELTASLQRFSAQLEHNPSMLIYGKPVSKPGPGE